MRYYRILLIWFCAAIVSVSGAVSAQPQAPVVTPSVSGTWAKISWNAVSAAKGYTLAWAPKPFAVGVDSSASP